MTASQRSNANAPYAIRVFGDPVLKSTCPPVLEIDDAVRRLADDMIKTMYLASGAGLAAPQVGVQKRLFVYDAGDGPKTILNAEIVESSGTWTFEEGCLSVPGMSFDITRPNKVVLKGIDLDGNDLVIEASEYLGRIFQHELDHLNGTLLLSRLDPDQRKQAMRALRDRDMRSN
jgi:peptide deformylase